MIRELARLLPRARASRLYRTPSFPPGSGPEYVNAAVAAPLQVPCGLEGQVAEALLAQLHALEAAHGRERDTRWGPRTLDLDLLAIGALVLPDAATQRRWRDLDPAAQRRQTPDRLILPHPRLQDRAFVLVPLADVAPDWRHPETGLSVLQMLAALPPEARAEVQPLATADQNGTA